MVPYSDAFGSAPEALQRTVAGAIAQNGGGDPGAPSTIGQLAHLAFPLATGEQGALNANGLPAVLVQVTGEATPPAGEAVSAERLEGFGRAALSAVDALDTAPAIESAPQTGLVIGRQALPEWVLRLLLATLLIPPLLLLADGYARLRRRQGARGDRAMLRGLGWTRPARCRSSRRPCSQRCWASSGRCPRRRCPCRRARWRLGGSAVRGLLAVALVLGLAWLAWPWVVRRLGLRPGPTTTARAWRC